MLYLSTRSKAESFTSHRALHENCTPDGGFFVPFRLPVYDACQISHLKSDSFGETVARVLGDFFSTDITGWDVDCVIGKNAVNLTSMSQRIIVGKLWNNPDGSYRYLVTRLYERLSGAYGKPVPAWPAIAIRIAVLFGVTGEMQRLGVDHFDVAVTVGDFSLPMAAWYARRMGLPIDTIICACNENNACWDLLHRGEMDTGATVVKTLTLELDAQNPSYLEQLIFSTVSVEENLRYLEASGKKRTFYLTDGLLPRLSQGLFVSVVGQKRVEPVINSVYRTGAMLLDPYAAIAYGGLQDYRAKTGESRPTLVLSDKSPATFLQTVCHATGLTKEDVKRYI